MHRRVRREKKEKHEKKHRRVRREKKKNTRKRKREKQKFKIKGFQKESFFLLTGPSFRCNLLDVERDYEG